MGKLFIVHPGGNHTYCCKECKTPIAAKKDFIDRCKTLVDGQGFLFSAGFNLKESHVSERIMAAADEDTNIVRYLSCLKCKSYMGWRWVLSYSVLYFSFATSVWRVKTWQHFLNFWYHMCVWTKNTEQGLATDVVLLKPSWNSSC